MRASLDSLAFEVYVNLNCTCQEPVGSWLVLCSCLSVWIMTPLVLCGLPVSVQTESIAFVSLESKPRYSHATRSKAPSVRIWPLNKPVWNHYWTVPVHATLCLPHCAMRSWWASSSLSLHAQHGCLSLSYSVTHLDQLRISDLVPESESLSSVVFLGKGHPGSREQELGGRSLLLPLVEGTIAKPWWFACSADAGGGSRPRSGSLLLLLGLGENLH